MLAACKMKLFSITKLWICVCKRTGKRISTFRLLFPQNGSTRALIGKEKNGCFSFYSSGEMTASVKIKSVILIGLLGFCGNSRYIQTKNRSFRESTVTNAISQYRLLRVFGHSHIRSWGEKIRESYNHYYNVFLSLKSKMQRLIWDQYWNHRATMITT